MAIALSVVLIPLIVVFQRQHPRDLGLEPVGRAAPGDGDRVDNAPDNISDNIVDAEWAAIEWTLTRALRTSRFWWLFGAYFCGLYAWYAVQVHQTKYLVETGFSPSQAAVALG